MKHGAAGPPANTSSRSAGMVCSRWSRIFVENSTIFEGGRAAGQYEFPLGRKGLLPLVANLCEKLHDL
jgi:hypothetical protein